MKLFGFEITRAKSLQPAGSDPWVRIHEPFAGAWQAGEDLKTEDQLAFYAVFACVTRIASDVAKLEPRHVWRDGNVWQQRTDNTRLTILFQRPNAYQTWPQFAESWMVSKLTSGNTYALKVRGDDRGAVFGLHVLDPTRVTPLVSDSGDVYYRLGKDQLAQVTADDTVVPAREIIHDRNNCLFHPLVGISPLYAAAVSAGHGLNIQRQSRAFFKNGAQPSGVLTAPGAIPDTVATELKKKWETEFSGPNSGRVAVLGHDLKYQAMTATAEATQLVEQLKMTAQAVCTTFHVPGWKVGIGPAPSYNGAEQANQTYYSDCLQAHIEQLEHCLGGGLGLADREAIQLDLDGLIRTDSTTRIANLSSAVNGSIMSTNEARARMNLPPVEGGDTIWRQQQDHSIQALANRDQNTPLFNGEPEPAPEPDGEAEAREIAGLLARELMTEAPHG